LGISLGITYWVIAGFTTPLKTLVSVARNLGRGNWQEGVPKTESRYDEIQELESALNEGGQLMASQIASLEKTQIRLQSSETQLRTLVNNMREALFELDEEGKVCFLNPAWLQVTGFGISESFGKPFSKFLVHAEDRVLFEKDRLHVLDIRNREMEMISSSERRIWVELDAHATFDAEGQPIGVVGRFQDVSQRVELSESLERHQQELYKISVTDDLTGLYNRRHFDQILADLLPRAMNEKKPLCLVL
ncbi:MAG: PAS domain S-box protein, partial [Anaerolineae bacterium]|nr:PAS domain S-box protein [Anaerolineae bacterium]